MVRKLAIKTDKEEYIFITVQVKKYNVSVDASRNSDLINLDKCDRDTKIYRYETTLEIEGVCIYPDHLKDATYSITLFGEDGSNEHFSRTLKDCHAIDDKWQHIYKTVKGQEAPVYTVPDGIGYINRQRASTYWSGCTTVPTRVITDMLALLPHIKPLYLELNILKKDKLHKMVGLSLKNNNPAE